MKEFNSIRDIDTTIDEGKMLASALAILTSIETSDERYGGMQHPDTVLKRIENLSRIIYERENIDMERHVFNKNRLRHKFL